MNEPIELRDAAGTIWAYGCPQCRHTHANVSGGTFEGRREDSKRNAARCCRCQDCGAPIGRRFSLRCDACEPIYQQKCAEQRASWQEEEKPRAARREAALEQATDRAIAESLQSEMSEISEEYYCASWLIGLEFQLWAMVKGGDRRFGLGEVTEREIDQLRALHDQCGGWWYYSKENEGETFIPTVEWEEMYAKGFHLD